MSYTIWVEINGWQPEILKSKSSELLFFTRTFLQNLMPPQAQSPRIYNPTNKAIKELINAEK